MKPALTLALLLTALACARAERYDLVVRGGRVLDPECDQIEVPERGRDYGMTYASDSTDYYYWRNAGDA